MSRPEKNDNFVANVSITIDKMKQDMDQVVMLFGAQVLKSLIYLSPVDTGRFRANWQVSMDSQKEGVIDSTDTDGETTISRETGSIMEFTSAVHSIWFVNNLVYAYALEMGHSQQAPSGMIGVTTPKIQRWINSAVQEVNKNVR